MPGEDKSQTEASNFEFREYRPQEIAVLTDNLLKGESTYIQGLSQTGKTRLMTYALSHNLGGRPGVFFDCMTLPWGQADKTIAGFDNFWRQSKQYNNTLNVPSIIYLDETSFLSDYSGAAAQHISERAKEWIQSGHILVAAGTTTRDNHFPVFIQLFPKTIVLSPPNMPH